jgi:hypothetical protein
VYATKSQLLPQIKQHRRGDCPRPFGPARVVNPQDEVTDAFGRRVPLSTGRVRKNLFAE